MQKKHLVILIVGLAIVSLITISIVSNQSITDQPSLEISLIGFIHGQIVNEPISDFTIKLEGVDYNYKKPDLVIKTDEDRIIWTNENIPSKYPEQYQPSYFCKEYEFNKIGGPVTINETGYYYLVISLDGENQLNQGFSVRKEPVSGGNIPLFNTNCD